MGGLTVRRGVEGFGVWGSGSSGGDETLPKGEKVLDEKSCRPPAWTRVLANSNHTPHYFWAMP